MIVPLEDRQATRRDWIGLAVIALPCLLYSMDLTVLNLALPRLAEQLRPSGAQLLWIVDIYGFFVAGMLVTMGNLGDRIGRRRLLMVGAAAFGVGSVLAALSTSAGMLIAARALLGVAGATLAPSTLSLIRNMFLDPGQRSVAIGVWISSYSVGGAIGPLLGGIMLQHWPWGSVFLLAVPVMALLLAVGPWLLPEFRDPTARLLDVPSVALSLAAMLSVIYGVKRSAQEGLGFPQAAAIGGGLVVGVLFVRRQRRVPNPLIDLGLFAVPAFGVSLATYLLGTLVAFGAYVLEGQYLQLVLGLSPLSAGLWSLPWSAGFIVGSTVSPRIARRVRPAHVMGAGLLLASLGFAVLTRIGDAGLGGFVVSSVLMSLGLSPVFTLATDLIVGTAPPERAGAAAAISETGAELGGALGVAILGSAALAMYRTRLVAAALPGLSPEARRAARETLAGAVSVADTLAGPARAHMLEVARGAFVHALEAAAVICCVASVLTAIVVLVGLRNVRAGHRSARAQKPAIESSRRNP